MALDDIFVLFDDCICTIVLLVFLRCICIHYIDPNRLGELGYNACKEWTCEINYAGIFEYMRI